jgi:hypothetical protein
MIDIYADDIQLFAIFSPTVGAVVPLLVTMGTIFRKEQHRMYDGTLGSGLYVWNHKQGER